MLKNKNLQFKTILFFLFAIFLAILLSKKSFASCQCNACDGNNCTLKVFNQCPCIPWCESDSECITTTTTQPPTTTTSAGNCYCNICYDSNGDGKGECNEWVFSGNDCPCEDICSSDAECQNCTKEVQTCYNYLCVTQTVPQDWQGTTCTNHGDCGAIKINLCQAGACIESFGEPNQSSTCTKNEDCQTKTVQTCQNGECKLVQVNWDWSGTECTSDNECQTGKWVKRCISYNCHNEYVNDPNATDSCQNDDDCGKTVNTCSSGSCVSTRVSNYWNGFTCSSNDDCSHWTCNCNTLFCTLYNSPGTSDCTPGESCSCSYSHNICSGNDCVTVSGAGTNECTNDQDCQPPTTTTRPPTPTTTRPPPTTISPTTTITSPPPSCTVTLEAIPRSIFLGRSITLRWHPLNCDSCQATTTLEDGTPTTNGGNWQRDPLKLETTQPKEPLNQKHQTSVTPLQKGTYIYKITCNNAEAEAEAQVTAEAEARVKVLPVPFWREIIPVLPGFLRGLFK